MRITAKRRLAGKNRLPHIGNGDEPGIREVNPAEPSWPATIGRNPPAWHESTPGIRPGYPGPEEIRGLRLFWFPRPDEFGGDLTATPKMPDGHAAWA